MLTVIMAATLTFAAIFPKNYHMLETRAQAFTRALTAGDSRTIFNMFVPQFQEEIGFERFDSALSAWYAGRRIVRARSLVVNITGLGGHVSTWPFFAGRRNYSYLYQSWLFTDQGWKLIWLSRVLNQSHQYGQSDTMEMGNVVEAALTYLCTPAGLNELRRGLRLPDTVVVVWRLPKKGAPLRLPGRSAVILMPDQLRQGRKIPDVPLYFEIAAVRILGNLATCAVDLVLSPPDEPGRPRRSLGIQLYLEKKAGNWQIHSRGRKW